MKSRIRYRNGRITWKLSNGHASVEAVIAEKWHLSEFLQLLQKCTPADGDNWFKNAKGQFQYCLSVAPEGYAFCIFNAFKDNEHDYCATIDFKKEDVSNIITSIERFLAMHPSDLDDSEINRFSVTDNASIDDDYIDFTMSVGDETVQIRLECLFDPFNDLIGWLAGIVRGERWVCWKLVEFYGPYSLLGKSTDSSFHFSCYCDETGQTLIDARMEKSELVEAFYRLACERGYDSEYIEEWLQIN
ncbi:MAG: hypothetical protein FIA89_03975 [Geobacter sp.]|nr:hypothetical protein [Geobacter sp.]